MHIRRAMAQDLPEILRMLFDDRATPSNEADPQARCYADAFAEIAGCTKEEWRARVARRRAEV